MGTHPEKVSKPPRFAPMAGSLAAAAWPAMQHIIVSDGDGGGDGYGYERSKDVVDAFLRPAGNLIDVEAKLRAFAEFHFDNNEPLAARSVIAPLGTPLSKDVEIDDYFSQVLWTILADVIRLNKEAA